MIVETIIDYHLLSYRLNGALHSGHLCEKSSTAPTLSFCTCSKTPPLNLKCEAQRRVSPPVIKKLQCESILRHSLELVIFSLKRTCQPLGTRKGQSVKRHWPNLSSIQQDRRRSTSCLHEATYNFCRWRVKFPSLMIS